MTRAQVLELPRFKRDVQNGLYFCRCVGASIGDRVATVLWYADYYRLRLFAGDVEKLLQSERDINTLAFRLAKLAR